MNTKQSDLQSFGELEKHFYGGPDSYSFFNRDIKKCMPFTQSSLKIKKSNGSANFGFNWSVVVNNNDGDYLTNTWLCITVPEVRLKPDNIYGDKGVIRWTENLMHNLIEECSLCFNDVVISKLDNFSLDFFSEFNTEESKYKKYMENIGNIKALSYPNTVLKSKNLFLPLPLFFTKDTGNAIPLLSLPHTEIKFNFKFRNWENLLILENTTFVDPNPSVPVVDRDIEGTPSFVNAELFGNFITVSEEERMKVSVRSKTMIVEQVQTSPRQMVTPSDKSTKIDLLFKQSVKTLYFAIRNTTFKNVWSNYNYDHDKFIGGVFTKNSENNIIKSASLKYNDRYRVEEMPSEYFQYIAPWNHSERIPDKHGLLMYTYSLNQKEVDPAGGVSLSRIDNPSLEINLTESSQKTKDNMELIVVAVTNNIIKISEGMVTFPVLNV